MTPRKKKGVGLIVTGIVTAVVGVVLLVTTATPEWVIVGVQIVGAVCSVLGIVFVAPDPSV
jgi:hypothetical protein